MMENVARELMIESLKTAVDKHNDEVKALFADIECPATVKLVVRARAGWKTHDLHVTVREDGTYYWPNDLLTINSEINEDFEVKHGVNYGSGGWNNITAVGLMKFQVEVFNIGIKVTDIINENANFIRNQSVIVESLLTELTKIYDIIRAEEAAATTAEIKNEISRFTASFETVLTTEELVARARLSNSWYKYISLMEIAESYNKKFTVRVKSFEVREGDKRTTFLVGDKRISKAELNAKLATGTLFYAPKFVAQNSYLINRSEFSTSAEAITAFSNLKELV